MNNIWDTHFGFLADGDDAYPIAIGEFGGKYTKYSNEKDKLWQDQFVAYLVDKDIRHFFYWCLNSNSGDTNGILEDDWTTVDEDKMSLLAPLLRGNTND
jgi:endoglucanase